MHFTAAADPEDDTADRLPAALQQRLLASDALSPFAELLRRRWIGMSFAVGLNDASRGIVRVYLLPEDVDHRLVPRGDPQMRKARLQLLSRLDFSPNVWRGEAGTPSQSPVADEAVESLLQIFNTIPSPDPRPDVVNDPDARESLYMLLDGSIPGVTTELYPYQRRAAAAMLQREAQPEPVLDPRLMPSTDHAGGAWFYDAVNGAGFREPRRYDGARGGILAEQMGAGKTLICLTLILATRHQPSRIPDIYRASRKVRPRLGSLADMAAACATHHGVPWRLAFGTDADVEYTKCVTALERNRASYDLPRPPRRRATRRPASEVPPTRIYPSHASLVVVPPNLVQQWRNEVTKHTTGLNVLVLHQKEAVPPVDELLRHDVVIFSSTRFERLLQEDGAQDANGAFLLRSPLARVHFKRCIVDEGHRLGNATTGARSNLHLVLDCLQVTSRWVVTGTPSKGLYGVDEGATGSGDASDELEKDDLRRIGSIAALYLKARPWANAPDEPGDAPADWSVYVMQPRHSRRSTGRKDCLKATLASLMVRHRLSDIGSLLPAVDERTVYLDGSYQDVLCLNLFSMVVIFNAVQSQRADQDYFFHPRQRKNLAQLVSNLRQASFFGGSFFSPGDVRKALDTAAAFLTEGKVAIGPDDDALLRGAIAFGELAAADGLKGLANAFHEIPVYVEHFPGGLGRAWSLDDRDGDPVCTDSRMVSALQRFLQSTLDAPASLQLLFASGRFEAQGREERASALAEQEPARPVRQATLAGNTQPGRDDTHPGPRARRVSQGTTRPLSAAGPVELAAPLAKTRLVSTASAKLSYLLDQVVQHQRDEQIIIFYENDNVAYYLAGMLEILQVQHLIYAKGITVERRAQYVATFNKNPKFRVLLMDITQAAFGLDMRSASRIYFVNPVLNPQVEAQAIGRARRISQQKPVTVETLVLRGSIDEVIVRRRGEMSQAEQRKCRSILDDRPLYEWILNARLLPLPAAAGGLDQTAPLRHPQPVFGRGFGQGVDDPDQDLVMEERAVGRTERKRPSGPDGRAPKRRAVRFESEGEN
ncbi:helicase-like protein [Thozetella sp. PMI_491]|nr:helicase-like protein [Thozetella sp. PMI_491]